MRRLIIALLVGMLVSGANVSLAQNGAEVTKGVYIDYFGTAYNPDEGLTYFFSTFSDVCGFPFELGEVLELPWLVVHRPNDDEDKPWDGKYKDSGFFFFRVLTATEDEFWSDPCGVWSNADLIFADGMIHSTYNDNDQFPANTKRQNVWGFTASGALQDFGDNCKGEMVGMKWQWRAQMDDEFPDCIPDCQIKVLNERGPELKCN